MAGGGEATQRVSGRERERDLREICVLERGIWGKEWQCKRKCKGVQRIVVGEESCRAELGELQCDCQSSFEGEGGIFFENASSSQNCIVLLSGPIVSISCRPRTDADFVPPSSVSVMLC